MYNKFDAMASCIYVFENFEINTVKYLTGKILVDKSIAACMTVRISIFSVTIEQIETAEYHRGKGYATALLSFLKDLDLMYNVVDSDINWKTINGKIVPSETSSIEQLTKFYQQNDFIVDDNTIEYKYNKVTVEELQREIAELKKTIADLTAVG